ncbi:MAG: SCP2 sterol-binding domain-containing protein [Anaerolineaceae bacterium]|nr:SCP2 sterol-binding domain-containing protein [Anaerolineaceae bacterium]
MPERTIASLMELLPAAFLPEKSTGMDVVIQFHATGEGGGDWNVLIRDKSCRVQNGVASNPNLALEGKAQDFLDVFSGRLNAMQAYMQGKLVLRGDKMLAMRLAGFFKVS